MKLTIGENIRLFRRKNEMTQEQLAQRLGVTYQSVSRWENGTTSPDLELLPAISELLSVTVDELIGMPQFEIEKSADEAFDELDRECMKESYDAEKIKAILADIRRNYIGCNRSWRLWIGNERAYRDPKILPEVRLTAEEYLRKRPMNSHVIQTMANIEDEEHLDGFLKSNTTALDCSKRKLLFNRYLRLGDEEKFEPDGAKEKGILLSSFLDGISSCFNIFPSRYVSEFDAEEFEDIREDERFVELLRRVKALVLVKEKTKTAAGLLYLE